MKSGPSAAYKFFCGRKKFVLVSKKRIIIEYTTLLPSEFLDRVEFGNNKKKRKKKNHMYVP